MAQHQRGDHHHHLRGAKAKAQLIAGQEGDEGDHRDRQRDGGQHRAEKQIHRPLYLIVEHRFQGAKAFRRQDQQSHQEAGKGHRGIHAGQQRFQRVSVHFGNRDHCHQVHQQPGGMPPAAVGGRFTVVRVVIVAVVFMLINKQALMGFGLNKQENAVHGRRNYRHQQRLPGAEVRARQRHRKDQHDNR